MLQPLFLILHIFSGDCSPLERSVEAEQQQEELAVQEGDGAGEPSQAVSCSVPASSSAALGAGPAVTEGMQYLTDVELLVHGLGRIIPLPF